jgi:hypothetical protein
MILFPVFPCISLVCFATNPPGRFPCSNLPMDDLACQDPIWPLKFCGGQIGSKHKLLTLTTNCYCWCVPLMNWRGKREERKRKAEDRRGERHASCKTLFFN